MYQLPEKLNVRKLDCRGFVALVCEDLPGCITFDATEELALERLREAIGAYLESLRRHHESPADPIAVDFDPGEIVCPEGLIGKYCFFDWFRLGGWQIDHQSGRHIILRHNDPPHRRITLPIPDVYSDDTLREILKAAGITGEQFQQFAEAPKRPGHDYKRADKRWAKEP